MLLLWAVRCLNNDRSVMSKSYAWCPLVLWPEGVSMQTKRRGLAAAQVSWAVHWSRFYIVPNAILHHNTSWSHDLQHHNIAWFTLLFIHSNSSRLEEQLWYGGGLPVIRPEAKLANSFFIVNNSIMIGWCNNCNYFLSAFLTGQKCVIEGAWRHRCFVGTPDIVSDIAIPISGHPILYLIL